MGLKTEKLHVDSVIQLPNSIGMYLLTDGLEGDGLRIFWPLFNTNQH